ncbi:MAG: aquaporin [Phycisphaeraceae bacterium]|nr:aquaporin [Phycisphaeraceae bacterium]
MTMVEAVARHWPEYVIEGVLLGLFMVSACVAVIVVEHPGSPVRRAVRSGLARRAIVGAAMGLTAVALITSAWGKRSGAHMNPAATLAFAWLGKVDGWDAAWYVVAQCIGGVAGVLLCRGVLGAVVSHPSVEYVVTRPGPRGAVWAFWGELGISFVLLLAVLVLSGRMGTAALTPWVVGVLLTVYIAFEAPLSGMSLNPARTLASAVAARRYTALWVYLAAPTLGMLGAAAVYTAVPGWGSVPCAKLDHSGPGPCLFHCEFEERSRLHATSQRDRHPTDGGAR